MIRKGHLVVLPGGRNDKPDPRKVRKARRYDRLVRVTFPETDGAA